MQTVTGAENVVWDLSDLYPSVGDDGLGKDLATIEERSKAFSDRWYGKIASLSIADFMTMVEEYEQLSETYIRMGSFVNLLYSTDSNNTEYGRMLQRVREVSARASSHTVFFTVQITQLSDERLQQLLDAPEMATRRHWLEGIIEEKAHMLTEDGERVMSAKSNTSRSSWVRLHDVLMNGASFSVRGEEMPLASVSRLMFDADRDLRKDAADALSLGLAKDAEQHAYVFNTIIADCEATDELRKYPTWISSRNMSNEVSDAAVETLIQSVVTRMILCIAHTDSRSVCSDSTRFTITIVMQQSVRSRASGHGKKPRTSSSRPTRHSIKRQVKLLRCSSTRIGFTLQCKRASALAPMQLQHARRPIHTSSRTSPVPRVMSRHSHTRWATASTSTSLVRQDRC